MPRKAWIKSQGPSVDDVLTVDFLQFDVSESETHKSTSRVTDHPVETGAQVSDHIQAETDTLDLVARISDTPIRTLTSEQTRAAMEAATAHARAQAAQGAIIVLNRPDEGPTRALAAYELLRGIKNAGNLVEVYTTLRHYKDMAITSLTVQRDARTGNVLALNLSLREIRTATSETVAAPKPKGVAKNRGQATKDKGKQPTEAAPAPVSETVLLQFGRWAAPSLVP